MAAGLALGFTAGAFAAALTSLTPGIFTSDVALHPTMRSLAPQVNPSTSVGTRRIPVCIYRPGPAPG